MINNIEQKYFRIEKQAQPVQLSQVRFNTFAATST